MAVHHKPNDAAARLALLPGPAADAGIQPGDCDIHDRYQNHQSNLVAMIAVVPRVSAKEGRKKIEPDRPIPARAISGVTGRPSWTDGICIVKQP
jgi:hypothetical protein